MEADRSRCAWLSVGTYYSTNLTLSWRLPLALACVGPLGLLAGLPFVPGKFPKILISNSDHFPCRISPLSCAAR